MSTSRATLDLWRMDDHAYSPTDTTVSHMFALCDVLALNGEHVPGVLCYSPSPVLSEEGIEESWPDAEYLARMDAGDLTADEARRALEVLRRYLRFVRLARPEEEA